MKQPTKLLSLAALSSLGFLPMDAEGEEHRRGKTSERGRYAQSVKSSRKGYKKHFGSSSGCTSSRKSSRYGNHKRHRYESTLGHGSSHRYGHGSRHHRRYGVIEHPWSVQRNDCHRKEVIVVPNRSCGRREIIVYPRRSCHKSSGLSLIFSLGTLFK